MVVAEGFEPPTLCL